MIRYVSGLLFVIMLSGCKEDDNPPISCHQIDLLLSTNTESDQTILQGTVVLEIKNGDKRVALQEVQGSTIVDGWNAFVFDSEVRLSTGKKYKIHLYRTGIEDLYPTLFWMSEHSDFYPKGVSSVDDRWPGEDFCFKIYANNKINQKQIDTSYGFRVDDDPNEYWQEFVLEKE